MAEYLFEMDYEMASKIKTDVIPKALLYSTGEISDGLLNEDDMYGEDEDDSAEDDDDEDDDDEDEEHSEDEEVAATHPRKKNKGESNHKGK